MVEDPDQIETRAEPIPGVRPQPLADAAERFAPGTLLASRYRIISRLGKGGMGEVFRADDLILRQPVALKFLPESARNNVGLLTRFYDEVRIARQISHKNVCRVYDIGEVNGQPYLSMEYIDGEDLGSLLRRIGRLPADKATEFARKLCAGVAAAHAQGVLHRDLKPANIMIDARGELRVTDFGLAAIAEQLKGEEIRNGTPAYMAPEQLTGTEVSAQSDLYAVGLIMYEMFTGRMPFEANSIAEMTRLRRESRITSSATLTKDTDPAVQTAILRCLESDPKLRPASALALSAMLPGGDPLAAALADGTTPSPELVAEAGSHDALSPKVAIPVLAAILLGLAAYFIALPRFELMNLVPMENPPEVLNAKARDIVRSFGYRNPPADSTGEVFGDDAVGSFDESKGHQTEDWRRLLALPPSALEFWYRQGPYSLAAQDDSSGGKTTLTDPPATDPGMITVIIDANGSLEQFTAVPPQHENPPAETKAPDWAPLFAAAYLDPAKFKSATPEWSPPVATDTRAAWTGLYRDRADLPVRIEAASFHNRPVYFQIVWPWTPEAVSSAAAAKSRGNRKGVQYAIALVIFIAALWIAHYNWKAGRADLRGATRVGIFCGVMNLIVWALNAHHVASGAEQALFDNALAHAAYVCLEYWLLYLALEPWVRRYWPQSMIVWSRVLAGKWKDPVVGRDLLFGVFFGIVYVLILGLFEYANFLGGRPLFGEFDVSMLNGFREFARHTLSLFYSEVGGSLVLLLTLFLARTVVKKQWLLATVWVVGWVVWRFFGGNFLASPVLAITVTVFWILLFSLLVFILLRFGFFALVVATFVLDSVIGSFLTTDFSAWYGQSSLAIAVLIVGMSIWAFRLSLGSRSLFSPGSFNNS